MKISLCIALLILLLPLICLGSEDAIPGYYNRSGFLFTPSGVYANGLLGFSNPANPALLEKTETRFSWSTDRTNAWSLDNWGLYIALPKLSYGYQRMNIGEYSLSDHRISLAFGSRAHAMGISYGWSRGDNDAFGRERILSLGSISRPNKYLSIGMTGTISVESKANELVADIGIRPLGSEKVTVFADAAIQYGMRFKNLQWSLGTAIEMAPGINLTGRYFENKTFTIGLNINFGKLTIGSQSHFNNDNKTTHYTHTIRTGGMMPNIFTNLFNRGQGYYAMSLKGRVDYHKYRYFDGGKIRFYDLLKNIQAAVDDPVIDVIALNISGLRIYPEHAWEIREELRQARAAGMKVIVFADRLGMTGYHLASMADKVVLDPEGALTLYGYSATRTYLKGTLDKLGLGFDEWRFFKYKSYAETYSREKMSEADREQNQAYIDSRYEYVRGKICSSRNIAEGEFDRFVDEHTYIPADDALDAGLVDTLARWSDAGKIISRMMGRPLKTKPSSKLEANELVSTSWGPRPKVAIVYGLGECAVYSGIKANYLERVFDRLKGDKSVKAVVFRVDSPGGDGMASDMVAEAVRECAKYKPVIVSQGQVAGSGGYWISTYADTIVAGPETSTGSIGVIGGWIYDKGFSDKLGMTYDLVKRGKSADIWSGITLPFLGLTLPGRNLTDNERSRVEEVIKKHYDVFVGKVAEGRDMTEEEVRQIAKGRFYSGLDGKKIGLVDEIGGLMTALAIAEEAAGLTPDDEIEIIEIPRYKGLFKSPIPKAPMPVQLTDNPIYKYLKMYSKNPGYPLPMMLPGTYPGLEN